MIIKQKMSINTYNANRYINIKNRNATGNIDWFMATHIKFTENFNRYIELIKQYRNMYYSQVGNLQIVNKNVKKNAWRELDKILIQIKNIINENSLILIQDLNTNTRNTSHNIIYASGKNGTMININNKNVTIKLIKLDIFRNPFLIFVSYFIQNYLYQNSDSFHKIIIPRVYILNKKNETSLQIYMEKIKNSKNFSVILNEIFQNPNLTEQDFHMRLFFQLILSVLDNLKYFQERFSFVHNDLKTKNILLEPSGEIYFVDFIHSTIKLLDTENYLTGNITRIINTTTFNNSIQLPYYKMSLCTDVLTFIYSILFDFHFIFKKLNKNTIDSSILLKYQNLIIEKFFQFPGIHYFESGQIKQYHFQKELNLFSFFLSKCISHNHLKDRIHRYNDNYKKLYQELFEYLNKRIQNKKIKKIISDNYQVLLNTVLDRFHVDNAIQIINSILH